MSPRMAAAAALAAAALLLACGAQGAGAQTEALPDPALFAPVQLAGDLSTGFPAYFVGCASTGATLQDIIVYANDNFLRGLEASLFKHHVPSLLSACLGCFLTCSDAHHLFGPLQGHAGTCVACCAGACLSGCLERAAAGEG